MSITEKWVKKKIKIKIFTSIGDNSVNDLRFMKRKLRSKYLDHIPVNLKPTTIMITFSKRETEGKTSSLLAAQDLFSRPKTRFSFFSST